MLACLPQRLIWHACRGKEFHCLLPYLKWLRRCDSNRIIACLMWRKFPINRDYLSISVSITIEQNLFSESSAAMHQLTRIQQGIQNLQTKPSKELINSLIRLYLGLKISYEPSSIRKVVNQFPFLVRVTFWPFRIQGLLLFPIYTRIRTTEIQIKRE